MNQQTPKKPAAVAAEAKAAAIEKQATQDYGRNPKLAEAGFAAAKKLRTSTSGRDAQMFHAPPKSVERADRAMRLADAREGLEVRAANRAYAIAKEKGIQVAERVRGSEYRKLRADVLKAGRAALRRATPDAQRRIAEQNARAEAKAPDRFPLFLKNPALEKARDLRAQRAGSRDHAAEIAAAGDLSGNRRAYIADLRAKFPHLTREQFDRAFGEAITKHGVAAMRLDSPKEASQHAAHAYRTPSGEERHIFYAQRAAAPAVPSLREQADKARAAKGTREERKAALLDKARAALRRHADKHSPDLELANRLKAAGTKKGLAEAKKIEAAWPKYDKEQDILRGRLKPLGHKTLLEQAPPPAPSLREQAAKHRAGNLDRDAVARALKSARASVHGARDWKNKPTPSNPGSLVYDKGDRELLKATADRLKKEAGRGLKLPKLTMRQEAAKAADYSGASGFASRQRLNAMVLAIESTRKYRVAARRKAASASTR